MLDARIGPWRNLFGRRTTPCGRSVRPQRGLSQETGLEDHTSHGEDFLGKFMVPRPGGASFLRKRNADPFAFENRAKRGFVLEELL